MKKNMVIDLNKEVSKANSNTDNQDVKVTVKDFVDMFNKASNNDKVNIVNVSVINNYISYAKKIDLCEKMVQFTSFDVNNNIKFNSPLRWVLFVYTLVDAYTCIDMGTDNMMDDFDLLEKNGVTQYIIDAIPSSEYTQLQTVLDMVIKDFKDNYYETHAYVSNEINKITSVFKTVVEPLAVKLTEKVDNMSSGDFDKLIKKIGLAMTKYSK